MKLLHLVFIFSIYTRGEVFDYILGSVQVLRQRVWGGVGGLSRNADTADAGEGVGGSLIKCWHWVVKGWKSQGLEQKSKENDANKQLTNRILPESWTKSITGKKGTNRKNCKIVLKILKQIWCMNLKTSYTTPFFLHRLEKNWHKPDLSKIMLEWEQSW